MKLARRDFIKATSGTAALGALFQAAHAAPGQVRDAGAAPAQGALTPGEFLKGLIYTREEVRRWLAGEDFLFAKYSSEFGWLLRSGQVRDGIDKANNIYTYGALDERITIQYRDSRCRINTYGDSFTQCHQVSDGETWQEVLAAHLQEPIRNFGIGGWSVYQAYLRMLREEQRVPADYVILNIYEDDHFRNLDSWRNIRAKKHPAFIEPTLPHVVVNAKAGAFEERPNPCPTPESVYHLTDLDWVVNRFKDDFALQIVLAHANAKTANPELSYADIQKLATTHGIVTRTETSAGLSAAAEALHCQAAYFSTERIVEKVEAYARQSGKRVLYVLSYSGRSVAQWVREGVRRDQVFVDYMRRRGLPVVDLLEAHVSDFANYKCDIKDYLARHFVGHYSPLGNFFCAHAIRDRLVQMLEPKPMPYRNPQAGIK